MDNITHALHGLALYALAMTDPALAHDPSAQSAVMWATALGSQAPDFDFVIRLAKGEVAYLRHHRGITHSIPAWFLWPTGLALALSPFHAGHFGLIWVWSFLGVLVHVGMDLLTTYGTVAFWPVTGKRIGGDLLMIVDLVLWGIGAWGIYLWSQGESPQRVVTDTMLLTAGYLLLRVLIQLRVRGQVRRTLAERKITRLSVIPSLTLLKWKWVAESEEDYFVGRVRGGNEVIVETRYVKHTLSNLVRTHLQAVETQSEIYRVFQWFARHPYVEAHPLPKGGVRFDVADLTFRMQDRMGLTAHIELDASGRMVQEYLGDKRLKKSNKKTHNV